jgi:capsular polysaccharide biosynthesis protein
MAKKSKKTSSPMIMEDRQWKIESALRTIKDYNEIVKDKKLMKEVATKAKEVATEAASIASGFIEGSKEIKFGK